MGEQFSIDYVELPNGRIPARESIDAQDNVAGAKIDAAIDRLGVYGNRMPGKMVSKLADDIFELRVKHFDRIFRVLFFYQPGMLIVITSCFQKKTQRTPDAELRRAVKLKNVWLRYGNEYPASQTKRDGILREVQQ
jgi:phage-related protein